MHSAMCAWDKLWSIQKWSFIVFIVLNVMLMYVFLNIMPSLLPTYMNRTCFFVVTFSYTLYYFVFFYCICYCVIFLWLYSSSLTLQFVMGYVQVLITSDQICCVVSMSILSHYLVFFEDHIHFIITSALVVPYIDLTHVFSITFEGIFFFATIFS